MPKRFLVIVVVAAFAVNASYAQTEAAKKTGNGYFFVAPGAEICCAGGQGIMQVGAGAEALIHKGWGVNADGGYMFPTERAGAGVLTLSAGPLYQFSRSGKTVPFVTGGLSLAVRQGVGGAYHIGGGVIRWFHPRWGVRVEVRDHIPTSASDAHLMVFRVGLALR